MDIARNITKIYADQEYFIWGDMLCRAVGPVRASALELSGKKAEILILSPDCTRREAMRISNAFGADTTFLENDDRETGRITGAQDVLIRRDRFAEQAEPLSPVDWLVPPVSTPATRANSTFL